MEDSVGQQFDNFMPLATKLHLPHPRQHLIVRAHLLDRLNSGIEQGLILISAPAGFGKTTLLAQWCAENALPVAWLSLESEDNELTRFLYYLIAALQMVFPDIGSSALALLHSPTTLPIESLLTMLSNELANREEGDFVLVLDDYHVITAEAIHHALLFLIGHLPIHMHIIVATRSDPPLPLARLRVRGNSTKYAR